MIGMITFIGSIMVAAFGFVLGKFYAETERILSDKRRIYEEPVSYTHLTLPTIYSV